MRFEEVRYSNTGRLIGEVITDVTLSDDRTRVTFTTKDDQHIVFETFGDCCSNTWVEHITVPGDLRDKGAVVVGVGERTMEDDGKSLYCEYPDVIAVYQTCWVTDIGEIILEYRNNSNGYYGGSLELQGE